MLVVIWGGIAYQISSFGSSDVTTHSRGNLPVSRKENTKPDTFSILANYRDPFLGKPIEERKPESASKKMPKPVEIKVALPWPKITYGGVIKNQKSSKQLYLVQVNGNDNIIKEGDVVEEVQITKAWKDSIQVVFEKEKRVFKK